MKRLLLIRHGQASFGGANYDKLSALGRRQCALLGNYWAQTQPGFNRVYAGALSRQLDSAQIALTAAGIDLPVRQEAAFDEFDFISIFAAYGPVVARKNPDFAVSSQTLFSDRRLFQRFFESLVDCWARAEPADSEPSESWAAFCHRVESGLGKISAEADDGDNIAVFTSGGVISVAARSALALADATAFSLNWRIQNASTHGFSMGRRGLSLLAFNNVAHLELERDAKLFTYR